LLIVNSLQIPFGVKIHVAKRRMFQSDNGGHNPVAEVDIDVTKRATGDLGSWHGYLAIRVCSMIVPEMIAPFDLICAAHSHSDSASVWCP
jgi:hypothetical protein